ncbi:MAG TPA: hypothetical protein PKA37_10935, partial [Planctomycetota bacterium]|nr:hypothetical protein [Planctomycetota bacterium]
PAMAWLAARGLLCSLSNSGERSVRLTLADGQRIESSRVRGVINRLVITPTPRIEHCTPNERDYILQESWAFGISLLSSFDCPVLNPASPEGLSGKVPNDLVFAYQARACGLTPVRSSFASTDPSQHRPPVPSTSNDQVARVQVIGNTWLPSDGHQDEDLPGPQCLAFAKRLGLPICGMTFVRGAASDWRLLGVDSHPDLRCFGPRVWDVLAETLSGTMR